MDKIIFDESSKPIIQNRLDESRKGALEVFYLFLVGFGFVLVGFFKYHITTELIVGTMFLIILGSWLLYISFIQYFNSKPLLITRNGIFLPKFGMIHILLKKSNLIPWESITEIIFNLNKTDPNYGVMDTTVYWIRQSNGKIQRIDIDDIVSENNLVSIMKDVCISKKIKYIESIVSPAGRFKKLYKEQFNTK